MRAREITEGLAHPVICVDVQPEYCGIADGDESPVCVDIIKFVVRQTGPVLMFVNAEEQGLSGDTVQSIKQYWDNTICPEEERYNYDDTTDEYRENPNCPSVDWRRFTIVDKGYGYFRSWMDVGISPATIIRVIRLLYQNKLTDSRELFGGEGSDDYDINMRALIGSEFRPWMLDDPISVNWTSVAQLKRFSGAYLVGGARDRCLREVELLMNAFNIRYRRIDHLVYDP
jgi:hypothetical protein